MSEIKVVDKNMEFIGLVLVPFAVLPSYLKKCRQIFNP